MPFSELWKTVLSDDLCTTCGACELACPKDAIVFDGLVPKLAEGASDATCGACSDCLTSCPGKDPETPRLEERIFGRSRAASERWLGIVQGIYGARATDPQVFERSASGGSTTTLLQAAMDLLQIDTVLVMGRCVERPWRSAPRLCSSSDELVRYAQSTYQLAPYLGALKSALREHPERRFGMVGIACQVQGMRKLQQMDTPMGELVRNNVVFIAEIACSSSTAPGGTESMIKDILGLPLEEVESLHYREGDYPGQIVIRTVDGKKHGVPFWQAVRHFKSNKTHRCLTCADWMSGLADVSISDGDPNIFDASLGLNDIRKHGRVFVRTERGASVLEHARKTGVLEVWPIDLVGLNLGLERKRNRRATYERMNVPIPAGPIPGHVEDIDVIPDDVFLATPEEKRALRAAPQAPAVAAFRSRG